MFLVFSTMGYILLLIINY